MPLSHILATLLATLLWGGNYVASRIGMETFPPLFYTFLRFVLVAAIMLPFAPRPTRAQMKQLGWIAFVLCVGHMGIILIAIDQGLNIGASAITVQMGVPFSCMLGAWLLKDKLGKWRITGMLIAFAGCLMITGEPNVEEHPLAFFFALVSALLWGVSNIQIKKLGKIPTRMFLAYTAILSLPMLLPFSLIIEGPQWHTLTEASLRSTIGLIYTVLASTLVAYGLWAWMVQHHDISKVAPYSLLVPLFGIACGKLFFEEPLTPELLIGGAVLMLGVAIITLRRPKLREMPEGV